MSWMPSIWFGVFVAVDCALYFYGIDYRPRSWVRTLPCSGFYAAIRRASSQWNGDGA